MFQEMYVVQTPGIGQVLVHYVLLGFILMGLALIGLAVNTFIFRRSGCSTTSMPNIMLQWALHFATGWSVWILVLLVLAFVHLFIWPVIFGTGVCTTAGAWLYVRRHGQGLGLREWNVRTLVNFLPFALLGLALSLLAFHPPGMWDDTSYHLPYARFLLEQQGLAINPYLRFPFFPQHLHLVFAAALSIGDAVFVQLVNMIFPIIIALLLGGLGRELGGSYALGFLAAIFFLGVDPVQRYMPYAYVDLGYALFSSAAVVGVFLWSRYGQEAWLWISALAGGAAIGTKYFGCAVVAILAAVIWVWGRSFRKTFIYGLIVICVGGFWYIRNWILAGDPVHPLGGPIWGFYLWDQWDWASQIASQSVDQARNLKDVIFELADMDAWLLIVGLGVVVLFPLFPPGMGVLWVTICGYSLIWVFLLHGGERYVLPALPIGSFLGLWGLFTLLKGVVNRTAPPRIFQWFRLETAGLVAASILALHMALTNAQISIQRAQTGYETLLRAKPGYDVMRKANEYSEQYGHKVYQLGFENLIYFVEGQVIGDWFGPGRYRAIKPGPGSTWDMDKLRTYFSRHDIQLLVVNSSRFDLDLGPLREQTQVLYEDEHGMLVRVDPKNSS